MSRFLLDHQVQTHNNSLNNLIHGVGERVLYINSQLHTCIKPRTGKIFEEKLASYRDLIATRVGRQSPVAREVFPSFYKGPRNRLYQRAVEELAMRPFRPKDAMLKTFVKAEKQNFTLKPNPVPRVIQPRSPRFNVEIGRYLRPIEHKIYSEIDHLFKSPTIMSPYNAYEQAKHIKNIWDTFRRPVCIGLDASRFDQHVSAQALRFEHELYNKIYRSAELRGLMSLQVNNFGIAQASDGYFQYKVTGSRMSGDMNTSLGNKILMCLMARGYMDSLTCRTGFVNNGDDCLLFVEQDQAYKLKGLHNYFKDFGFNIVEEKPVTEFEHIVFCQTSPVISNGIWRMVRNIKTCLTKDVTALSLGHNVELYRALMKSIGDCGNATARDVPVLGAFYSMLTRFGLGSKVDFSERGYSYYYRSSMNAKCLHNSPDDQGRYSFYLSTGLIPDAQEAIEDYFNSSVWGDHNHRQVITYLQDLIK
jgi:hypothetical protein